MCCLLFVQNGEITKNKTEIHILVYKLYRNIGMKNANGITKTIEIEH